MKIAKRILLFAAVNILIVAAITTVMSILGVSSYVGNGDLNYESLAIFCLLWGFGGAFISLLLSRPMAKWMTGVKVIGKDVRDPELLRLVERVHFFARKARIEKMPEVGIYESPELNAFATGATKNRALVAVSRGLLNTMNPSELDGVLAHEVAHIANGDMVTMTLVQGVVNALIMFAARILAHFACQFVDEEKRGMVRFLVTIVSEIVLGFVGMIVVAQFSRHREYRADAGGASLASRSDMIAALERLRAYVNRQTEEANPALATLKISGKPSRFLKLLSTHPPIEDRINHLRNIG